MKTISRQLRYQRNHKALGLCNLCPLPVAQEGGALCPKHMAEHRERQRKRRGSVRRYRSLSYRIQELGV